MLELESGVRGGSDERVIRVNFEGMLRLGLETSQDLVLGVRWGYADEVSLHNGVMVEWKFNL